MVYAQPDGFEAAWKYHYAYHELLWPALNQEIAASQIVLNLAADLPPDWDCIQKLACQIFGYRQYSEMEEAIRDAGVAAGVGAHHHYQQADAQGRAAQASAAAAVQVCKPLSLSCASDNWF